MRSLRHLCYRFANRENPLLRPVARFHTCVCPSFSFFVGNKPIRFPDRKDAFCI